MASGKFGGRLLVVAVVLIGAAVALGTYGLDQRQAAAAVAKEMALYQAATGREPLLISGQATAAEGEVDRAQLTGRLDAGRQLLVPRVQRDGRPGYDVWTTLQYSNAGVATGELVVINRGWIAESAKADAATFAVPDGDLQIEGFWTSLPVSSPDDLSLEFCQQPTWPKTLNKAIPSFADAKCLFNSQQIAQGLVLLISELAGELDNDWIGQQQAAVEGTMRKAWVAFGSAAAAIFALLIYALLGRRRSALPAETPRPAAGTEPGAAPHPDRAHHSPLGKLPGKP